MKPATTRITLNVPADRPFAVIVVPLDRRSRSSAPPPSEVVEERPSRPGLASARPANIFSNRRVG